MSCTSKRTESAFATAAWSSTIRTFDMRRATVPAPLDELPLLARAGTLLSLLTPDVDTLAAYGGTAPVVSLAPCTYRPNGAPFLAVRHG